MITKKWNSRACRGLGRPGKKRLLIIAVWLLIAVGAGLGNGGANRLSAQEPTAAETDGTEPAAAEKEAPKPVTTSDPAIPLDQLRLLVKPLTREELEVEAVAWRDLLKEKVQEIVDLEIRIAQEAAATATGNQAEANDDTEAEKNTAPSGDEPQADVGDQRVDLIEQRFGLLNRLGVVLGEWESKGGDPEPFHQYVSAIQDSRVQVTDAVAMWASVQAWLRSPEGGIRWAFNIGKFLVLLVAFWLLAGFVRRVVNHAIKRWKNASQLLRKFLANLVHKVVLLIGLVVALSALEVDVTPILALIGAAGFVIGLALQGTLSNFASGMLILAYRPFDVGDVVDAGGVSGTVESVNLLSTHILTFDNKHIIVPNNDVWGGVITNATASDTRRVDLVFGIGYDDDIGRAESVLQRIVAAHPAVLENPAPNIKLNELADSSVNFICRPWCRTEDYWTVYWDLTRSVKEAFDEEGISIPYPQRDVHVYGQSPAAT